MNHALGGFPEVFDHVPTGGVGFLVVPVRLVDLSAERLAVAADRGHCVCVVAVFLEG